MIKLATLSSRVRRIVYDDALIYIMTFSTAHVHLTTPVHIWPRPMQMLAAKAVHLLGRNASASDDFEGQVSALEDCY